jgi:hypothetical protein
MSNESALSAAKLLIDVKPKKIITEILGRILQKPLSLQRVFHGIRFKVKKIGCL